MKKLLLIGLLFTLHAGLKAQTVPNAGFESWQSTPYDEPNGWTTSNSESLRKNATVTATKVTGQSGNAIRLETVISNGDTMGGFVVNTSSDPLAGNGGFPYSQAPENITGYYKYTPVGMDSAIILVLFKKAGNLISGDFYKLGPAANFTAFSFPINFALPITPDSVIIGAASSNLVDNIGVNDGSVLVIDELSFTGTGITQAIPNGNFENWTTKSFDRLNGWELGGESLARTNDKHNGTYAVMLQTVSDDNGGAFPTQISSGHFNNNGQQSGGQPYTHQVDTLVGWYKFSGTADSGAIQVTLKKNGSVMQGFNLSLPPAATYTEFSLVMNASQVPDSIIINIASSTWPTSATDAGSTLTIDDVTLKSEPLGIHDGAKKAFAITAFPNPAADNLTLILPEKKTGTLAIYDLTGKKLMTQDISGRIVKLNVQSLTNGMYIYEFKASTGEIARDRFIKN